MSTEQKLHCASPGRLHNYIPDSRPLHAHEIYVSISLSGINMLTWKELGVVALTWYLNVSQPIQTVSSVRDLGLLLNPGFSADDNVACATKKASGMRFYLKRSFAPLTPSMFLPVYKTFIHPHLEYAIQESSPILSRDRQALESVQKLAGKFVKGLRHVPYETALQRLRLFSLVRKRIRGYLICLYKIIHGLLDFPCDEIFAPSTRIGLRGHTFQIHQQRCKTRPRQHAFSFRRVTYWNKLPEEIANASPAETFKFRLDARWQSFFPEVALCTIPQYYLTNLFHPVVFHPYAFTWIILGRL